MPLAVKSGVGLVFIENVQSGTGSLATFSRIQTIVSDSRVLPSVVADRVRISSGKWYFEARVSKATKGGRCSIGFASEFWGRLRYVCVVLCWLQDITNGLSLGKRFLMILQRLTGLGPTVSTVWALATMRIHLQCCSSALAMTTPARLRYLGISLMHV